MQPGFDGKAWAAALEATTDQVIGEHLALDPPNDGPVRASDGRSIWLDPNGSHLTHPTVLAQEERIITFALDAHHADPSPSPTVDVAGLDVLQADAARAVAGTDQLVLVVGPAGTGKTTTLAAARTDLAHQRRLVFGVAPTAKAARVLEAETGIRAETLAKLLYEWDRPAGWAIGHTSNPPDVDASAMGPPGAAEIDRGARWLRYRRFGGILACPVSACATVDMDGFGQ